MDNIVSLIILIFSGVVFFVGGVLTELTNPSLSLSLYKYSSLSFILMYIAMIVKGK